MIRFHLSREAFEDLDALAEYLRGIPGPPALRIGKEIQATLNRIAAYPRQGHLHERASSVLRREIRSAVCGSYVLFYAADARPVLFLAILHGKRDAEAIIRERLR